MESINQANTSKANPTSAPESKARIDINKHIPDILKEQWRNTVIASSPKTISLGRDWLIADLRKLLSHETEAGGLLSPEAVYIETGDQASISATSGTFTWHSHNEEPCLFSLQDWCSFIFSYSLWSLLITPENYRVYVKTDNRIIKKAQNTISGYSRGMPSTELMSRRLKKFAAKQFSDTDPETTELNIGRVVGITVGTSYQL